MFNFNLKGLAEWFKLGKNGPIIKKDGDKVQFRNFDDTDFINGQALDPIDPQDVVTKQYLEDNSDLASFNLNGSLFKNFDYQATSPIQIGTQDMPNLGLAYKVLIHVKTAFDGTTPTLEIGDATTNDRLASVTLSDLSEGEVFVITISDIFSADTTINGYLTPDSSTQGEVDVTVLYTISEEAPVGPVSSAIFDVTNTAGNLTISNTDKTLTHTSSISNESWSYLDPTIDNSLGEKNYLEFTIDVDNSYIAVGGISAFTTTTTTTGNSMFEIFAGSFQEEFYIRSGAGSGSVTVDGVIVETISNPVVNDKITLAIDYVNDKIWFAVNGAWTDGNPETNTGGYSIPNVSSRPLTYIATGFYRNSSGSVVSINETPTHPVTGFNYIGA